VVTLPLNSPCDGPVTYPENIKTVVKSSKGRSGPTLVKEIKQYQEKWLKHVQRMDISRIPKQALQYKPKGRRT
jgi:hypothetical protein